VICGQYPPSSLSSQEPVGRGRRRRCLLRGCEQWFCPAVPQSRYCSAACRQAARRWRRWQASRRWRASEQGRARRRQQGQRYRQRRRQATAVRVTSPPASQPDPAEPVVMAAAAQHSQPDRGREGQRPARIGEDFCGHPCQRPGCYVLFARHGRSPGQRFCCAQCRRALRRVLDREAKWRRRRQQRWRCWGARGRSPPEPC
jgi:hypothetical protein